MMRKYRIVTQVVSLFLFIVLFFFFNNQKFGYQIPSELLLRLNPFSALLTLLASHTIILSFALSGLIVALLTVVFGRFFCGFFCPLGTMIDAADTWIFKKMRSPERRPPLFFQRIKYVFMIALVVLALFGALFPLYLGPLSFTQRMLTILVDPILKIIGSDANRIVDAFSSTTSSLIYSRWPMRIRLYYGVAFTTIMALAIFAGGFWDKRFWCQYICPTGAFLGTIGRFSLFKRVVHESGCNSCQRCVRACPVHAIDTKNVKQTNRAECIECGICVQLKESCGSFTLGIGDGAFSNGPDVKRRHLMSGVAGGLLLVPLYRATAVTKRDDTGRLMRPPGALPEDDFSARCIGCGACMHACPTNTLQPCLFSDGFHRLYTPKVVPRIAGCEEKCHLCGHVCPTQAIRPLSYEEKRFAKIGTAVLDRNRCLAWSQNKECLVCDEVCPYNAISAYVVETTKGRFKVPVVDETLCLGCGMCEQHCPIFDTAAIVVYKFGENRIATGSYANATQKQQILEKRRSSDSKQLGASNGASPSAPPANPGFSDGFTTDGAADSGEATGGSALPEGFLE